MRLAAKIFIIVAISSFAFIGGRAFVAEIRRQEELRREREEGFNMKKASRMIPAIRKIMKSMSKAFTEIPKRLKRIGNSLELIGKGIFGEMKALSAFPPILANETVKVAKCGYKFMANLTSCWLFYLCDFIVGTLYAIFVLLPLYCLYILLGIDLYDMLDMVFDMAEDGDKMVYSMSGGYHIFHYPDSITSKCYSCNGPNAKKLNEAKQNLKKPVNDIIRGSTMFGKVFS